MTPAAFIPCQSHTLFRHSIHAQLVPKLLQTWLLHHVREHQRYPLDRKITHWHGISSLWAQLEKGQREQWPDCVRVGALHRELRSSQFTKEEKIISRKRVSFFCCCLFFLFLPPHIKQSAGDKENFEPLVYRQKKSGNYGTADDTKKKRKWNSQIKCWAER